MSDLLDKLAPFEERFTQLEEKLADPAVAGSAGEYAEVAKEHAALQKDFGSTVIASGCGKSPALNSSLTTAGTPPAR